MIFRFLFAMLIIAAVTLSPVGAVFAAMLAGGVWSKLVVFVGLWVLA